VKARFSLKDIDKGWKGLMAEAHKLASEKGMHAKAGILGQKALEEHPAEEGGAPLTNVRLGAIHEFGAGRVPERSFIRDTFNLNRLKYFAELRALVGRWFDRKGKLPLRRALGLMALRMSSDQQRRILEGAGIPPPNAPATIEKKLRKGKWRGRTAAEDAARIAAGVGPRPLIDTGRLVGSLSHAVESGKEGTSS
jgi:hypothetical protein